MIPDHIEHKYNRLCECKECRKVRAETIVELVALVDILRQQFNNSKRHDLYLKVTNYLNELADKEIID